MCVWWQGVLQAKRPMLWSPVVAVVGQAWQVSPRLCGVAGFVPVDMSVHMSGVPLHGLHAAAGAAVIQSLM